MIGEEVGRGVKGPTEGGETATGPAVAGRNYEWLMVSHKRLLALPEIEHLRRLSQSLAMLDAIMSPNWESRYYSFNSKWADGRPVDPDTVRHVCRHEPLTEGVVRRPNAERSLEELVADLQGITPALGI